MKAPLQRATTKCDRAEPHGPAHKGPIPQRHCPCSTGALAKAEFESSANGTIQRHISDTANPTHAIWPSSVTDTVSRPGRPLDADTRAFMENRFGGHDFSAVRVHDDAVAAASARDVHAQAYTVGPHIVFGVGQYRPATDSGRHLLAHELAHTVQQQGLQRRGTSALADFGPEYQRLEGEAEHAADVVMRGGKMPALADSGLRLSPKSDKASRGKRKTVEHEVTSRYQAVEMTTTHKVNPLDTFTRKQKGGDVDLASFEVNRIDLHPVKGPVLKSWKQMAQGGGLRAIVTMDGARAVEAGLWQKRASSDELRKRWLYLHGWKPSEALDKAWKKAGGDTGFPNAAGGVCEMDHTVELQVGGDNTAENIQVLDREDNGQSGSLLMRQVFGLAESIAESSPDDMPGQIRMIFKDAHLKGNAKCGPCCKAADKLKALTKDSKADRNDAMLIGYDVSAGGSKVTLRVSDDRKPSPIFESDVRDNRAGAEIIPGLLLMTLHRAGEGKGKDKRGDHIRAVIDDRKKTRLPVTLPPRGTPVDLDVGEEGVLTLSTEAKKNPGITFTYDYLSPGRFTSLEMVPGGIAAEGDITTEKLPFLKRFDVSYAPDRFSMKAPLDKSKLQPPLPGTKVTDASLFLDLAPKLKPCGTVDFDFGTGRRLASASVEFSADESGVIFAGKLRAFLPGADDVHKGSISYRAGAWSGAVPIDVTQMARKLPYVKSGSVDVTLKNSRLGASGGIQLELPGGNSAAVELRHAPSGWFLAGHGSIHTKSPYLKPIDAALLYDGKLFRATGTAEFAFAGLHGTVNAIYEHKEGRATVQGKGRLKIDKGRAKGAIDVELQPSGKVTGKGSLSYEIKKDLVATAGITIDDKQRIAFDGELRLPDITLFKRIPEQDEKHPIFTASGSFPIPGASLGPLGLKVRLSGNLSWYYRIGPGVLKDVKAMVHFNPFEENPDFSFKLNAKASIPAAGGIEGDVGADAVLDAGIAEVGAGLRVKAEAGLEGKAELGGEINYNKDRFSIDAHAVIGGQVVLSAELKARMYAEAGVWRFKVRTEKTWQLLKGRFDTGLSLGLQVPLHYDSVDGFRVPKLSEIKRVPEKLDLDAPRMFGKLVDETTPVVKEL